MRSSTSMLVVALLPTASSLSMPFSSRTLTQPPPPKGFSWAVDVSELEGRVVKINRLVGGRSTGRTAVVHPDAASTSAENQQLQSLVLAARQRADSAVMRPPTTPLPMSLPVASAVVLAKLVTAELLLVKLVAVELLALTIAAFSRLAPPLARLARLDAALKYRVLPRLARRQLKRGVHACASHVAHALAPAVGRPLRFADGLRDGLLPTDAILTLGVRPRTAGRSPALAMAR